MWPDTHVCVTILSPQSIIQFGITWFWDKFSLVPQVLRNSWCRSYHFWWESPTQTSLTPLISNPSSAIHQRIKEQAGTGKLWRESLSVARAAAVPQNKRQRPSGMSCAFRIRDDNKHGHNNNRVLFQSTVPGVIHINGPWSHCFICNTLTKAVITLY